MLGRVHGRLHKAPTKEEKDRLREEGGKVKLNDRGFEIRKVAGFWKKEEGNTFHILPVLQVNDYLWDRVRG